MTKQCPQCRREYQGDDSFCLMDGALLVAPGSVPMSAVSGDQPTQVVSRRGRVKAGSNTRWPFIVIGLLAVVVAGLAGILFLRTSREEASNTRTEKAAANPANTPPQQNIAAPSNAVVGNYVPPSAPAVSPAGQWRGDWSSPSGAYLKFDLSLSEDGGRVDGQIRWTLVRTTRPDKISKIGSTATEYVSGSFDPGSRRVSMSGYRKDDPANMLVMLDQYRLNLSADGRTLNGAARNGGKWNGRISLSK